MLRGARSIAVKRARKQHRTLPCAQLASLCVLLKSCEGSLKINQLPRRTYRPAAWTLKGVILLNCKEVVEARALIESLPLSKESLVDE